MLAPDPREPGLWTNPDLPAGAPGVHALIIGVSRYDHLADGVSAEPERPTFGLGQLAVSAMTAVRFFGWLRSGYALNGWPVARVRLLLSPQKAGIGGVAADELAACDPLIVGGAIEATFDQCKAAIRRWYGDLRSLKAPAGGRSLLFFSGHGVQISRANQLLLPCDYGRTDGSLDEAIRTQNLFDGLASLANVPAHVVLLDACRNDIETLRKVVGTNVVDEADGPGNPRLELRVLRATAYGERAYQPRTAGGMSLFGQSLLDGLSAKPNPVLDEPPIELTRRGAIDAVEISDLQTYMSGRIAALIRAAKEDVDQVVRADDSLIGGTRIDVAEIARAPAEPASDASFQIEEVIVNRPAAGSIPEFGSLSGRVRPGKAAASGTARSGPMPPPAAGQQPGAWFERRYGERKRLPEGSASELDLHDIVGSEAISYPWKRRQLHGLTTGRSFDPEMLRLLSAARRVEAGKIRGIQAQLLLENHEGRDPIGYALTLKDFSRRPSCIVVPADPGTSKFQLEIDQQNDAFIRLALYLSPDAEEEGGRAAAWWDRMRALSAPAAATLLGTEAAADAGQHALREKIRSPLAAVVGAALLLRANRLDLMHDWARNLATWFETVPDGVVFWMEQVRRERRDEIDAEATAWFVDEMAARSLPFTCDALGLAANIVDDVKRGRLPVTGETRERAALLRERIDAVMPYFRDDGLFCAYAGVPDDWDVATMLGPPSTRPAPPRAAPALHGPKAVRTPQGQKP